MKSSVLIKDKEVKALSEKLNESPAFYLVDYLGLTVEEVNSLRKKLREENVYYKVIKNSLLARTFKESNVSGMDDFLVGPSALALATKDVAVPAKIISEFSAKQKKKLPKFKVAVLDGKVFNAEDIEKIATLPSKEELLSMLASGLNAPIIKLAQTLQSLITGFPMILNALKEKKESE